MANHWEFFEYSEFACPCCGVNETSFSLIDSLNTARNLAQIPFIIESGYRCEKHNQEINGATKSSHLKGLAADIRCVDDESRYDIVDALMWVGMPRIIIYPRHIHVDIDLTKRNPLLKLSDYGGN